MKIRQGIKLLDEQLGTGAEVRPGYHVDYSLAMSLNKGEQIEWDVDGQKITRLTIRGEVSRRDMIKGVYYSCIGMRENGYRKVKIAPIWGYGDKAIEGWIPANAVLIVEIWVNKIIRGNA
jgi:FKBP-type peptidyl-prolyl cis-trans isomerase